MANHKQGLAYYNVDTDRYSDRRIKRLKKAFGGVGIAVYDYILCEVYRDKGCGLEWDDDTAFDVADYFGLKETLVNEIVKYCGAVGLFDATLLSGGIITSKSIQRRYLEMMSRAKRTGVNIPEEWRISSEELAHSSEDSPKNTEVCETRARIIKEKKSKINKNNLSLTPSLGEESLEREIFLEIFFFKNFKRPAAEVERFVSHYAANGWRRRGQDSPVENRIELAKCWEPKEEPQRFQPDVLANWKALYKTARERNPGKATLLLSGLYAIEVNANNIRIKASKELKELMYANANFFNDEFFYKFYPDKTILWA